MKNSIFPSVLCLIFLFISCTTDDEQDDSTNIIVVKKEILVGKWYFVDEVVNGVSIPYNDHEDCGKDYIEFKENGTLWQMDVWDCDQDFEQLGVYTISDGKLTMNGEVIDVIKLNSSILSIKGEEDYDDDGKIDEVILNFAKM